MSTFDEITKEKQRLGEALPRSAFWLRACSLSAWPCYIARAHARLPQVPLSWLVSFSRRASTRASEGGWSSETTRAQAHCRRKISWRQPQLAEPQRSGSCPSNRQDAAGNHRCVQGRSPEPCRRRDCPTQAGWPRRRARWEALCHTAEWDGATRHGLKCARVRKYFRCWRSTGSMPAVPLLLSLTHY
jgi:hypothetical protein